MEPKTVTYHRNGKSPAEPQKARMVPCAVKPKTHGHHPANGLCPYCEPPKYEEPNHEYFAPFGWWAHVDPSLLPKE
jgi:hypothetical protein